MRSLSKAITKCQNYNYYDFTLPKKKKVKCLRQIFKQKISFGLSWKCSRAAGMAQWYRAGWSGVRVPVGAGSSPQHRVQTDSRIRPASYPMGTRGLLPWG